VRLHKVLARIARFNGTSLPAEYRLEAEEENIHVKQSMAVGTDTDPTNIEDAGDDDENEQLVPTTWQMLGHRVILVNFIVVIVSFSCASFNYYMIGFYMKYIKGDFWVNAILGASSQCIAYLCVIPTQKLFGTKRSIIGCYLLGGLSALPLLFIDPVGTNLGWLILVSVFVSRFSIGMAFVFVFSINGESFPSLFLPVSIGMSSAVGHMVSILSPEVAELDQPLPMITFLAVSIVGFVTHFFLQVPEDKESLIKELIQEKAELNKTRD